MLHVHGSGTGCLHGVSGLTVCLATPAWCSEQSRQAVWTHIAAIPSGGDIEKAGDSIRLYLALACLELQNYEFIADISEVGGFSVKI